jgi:hypothetical protein
VLGSLTSDRGVLPLCGPSRTQLADDPSAPRSSPLSRGICPADTCSPVPLTQKCADSLGSLTWRATWPCIDCSEGDPGEPSHRQPDGAPSDVIVHSRQSPQFHRLRSSMARWAVSCRPARGPWEGRSAGGARAPVPVIASGFAASLGLRFERAQDGLSFPRTWQKARDAEWAQIAWRCGRCETESDHAQDVVGLQLRDGDD